MLLILTLAITRIAPIQASSADECKKAISNAAIMKTVQAVENREWNRFTDNILEFFNSPLKDRPTVAETDLLFDAATKVLNSPVGGDYATMRQLITAYEAAHLDPAKQEYTNSAAGHRFFEAVMVRTKTLFDAKKFSAENSDDLSALIGNLADPDFSQSAALKIVNLLSKQGPEAMKMGDFVQFTNNFLSDVAGHSGADPRVVHSINLVRRKTWDAFKKFNETLVVNSSSAIADLLRPKAGLTPPDPTAKLANRAMAIFFDRFHSKDLHSLNFEETAIFAKTISHEQIAKIFGDKNWQAYAKQSQALELAATQAHEQGSVLHPLQPLFSDRAANANAHANYLYSLLTDLAAAKDLPDSTKAFRDASAQAAELLKQFHQNVEDAHDSRAADLELHTAEVGKMVGKFADGNYADLFQDLRAGHYSLADLKEIKDAKGKSFFDAVDGINPLVANWISFEFSGAKATDVQTALESAIAGSHGFPDELVQHIRDLRSMALDPKSTDHQRRDAAFSFYLNAQTTTHAKVREEAIEKLGEMALAIDPAAFKKFVTDWSSAPDFSVDSPQADLVERAHRRALDRLALAIAK